MFNAACKIISAAAILIAVGTSCSKQSADKAPTPEEAIAQINSAIDSGDYDGAIALIDSFNVNFKDATDLRKQTIGLKAKAIEGQTIREIERSDSLLTVNQLKIDSLTAMFVKVQNAVAPYYVVKEISKGTLVGRTAIEPRLGDSDTPWTLALNIAGQKADVNAVSFTDKSGNAIATIACTSADRAVKGADGTSTFFSPEEAESLARAMLQNPCEMNASATDTSAKVVAKFTVSQSTARAIASTYQLAQLKEERQTELINREKLERKLQIARDQMANNLPIQVTQ